jgi:hypothetical protein
MGMRVVRLPGCAGRVCAIPARIPRRGRYLTIVKLSETGVEQAPAELAGCSSGLPGHSAKQAVRKDLFIAETPINVLPHRRSL